MARTRAIRLTVIVVCAAGIAGMIVASATKHNGAALTFGLITAVAIMCQMVATTVVNEIQGAPGAPVSTMPAEGEKGEQLEHDIATLVAAGAEEAAVRDLVRRAVRFGRESFKQPT